jgi:hypothetical protein
MSFLKMKQKEKIQKDTSRSVFQAVITECSVAGIEVATGLPLFKLNCINENKEMSGGFFSSSSSSI